MVFFSGGIHNNGKYSYKVPRNKILRVCYAFVCILRIYWVLQTTPVNYLTLDFTTTFKTTFNSALLQNKTSCITRVFLYFLFLKSKRFSKCEIQFLIQLSSRWLPMNFVRFKQHYTAATSIRLLFTVCKCLNECKTVLQ